MGAGLKRIRDVNLRHFDFWIFVSVMLLLAIGLVMIFSASAPSSARDFKGDAYYIFRSQFRFALLGIAALLVFSFVPYKLWYWVSIPALLVSIGLLGAVLVLGRGEEGSLARRWILIGSFRFQPSEVAKFGMICFLSAFLSTYPDRLKKFFKGLLPYLLLIAVFDVMLILEPHLSGTIILTVVSVALLFAAGAKIRHFIFPGIGAIGAVAACLIYIPKFGYMKTRVITFLDPWKDKADTGWQIVNSLYAIGSGGFWGRGIGKSMQKFLYIPEPHNDFIFAVLAEELGFAGVAAVMLLFAVFIWRGFRIAKMANDMFASLLATGITTLIAVQSLFNIGVVSGSIPVTGVSLPFFSYGGTAMLLFLSEVGILLNISKSVYGDTVLPRDEIRAAQTRKRMLAREMKRLDDEPVE